MGVYKPLRLLQCPDVKNLGLLRLDCSVVAVGVFYSAGIESAV